MVIDSANFLAFSFMPSSIELAILSNIEYQNARLVEEGVSQGERLLILNKEANREKELFNRNGSNQIFRLNKKK